MILTILLQAADQFNCFASATLQSQVTSKIVTLSLQPNLNADCSKYYNYNNSAELHFGDTTFDLSVSDFEYAGGVTSINFDYSGATDPTFTAMLSETLIVYRITLVNVVQEGSISKIDHTYINATNCWADVQLTYVFQERITLQFTPLNCKLPVVAVNMQLQWRIGYKWSSYDIYTDYPGFNYATDQQIVVDSSIANFSQAQFSQFFADLETNITIEARISLSYLQNNLQMLIVSTVEQIKTADCLDLLHTTSYLSRFFVQFNFDLENISACGLRAPESVEIQASALGVFLKQTMSFNAFKQEASVLMDVPDQLEVLTDNTALSCVFVVTFLNSNGQTDQFYKIQSIQLSCLKQIEVIAGTSSVDVALFRISAERCYFKPTYLYDTRLQLVGKKKTGEFSVYVSMRFQATLFQDLLLITFDDKVNAGASPVKDGLTKLRKAMKHDDQVYFILMNDVERQVGYNLAFSISTSVYIWFAVVSGLVLVAVAVSAALLCYRSRI